MPERKFKLVFACRPDKDNCIIRSRQVCETPRIATEQSQREESRKRNPGISRRKFINRSLKVTAAGLLIPEMANGVGTTVITNSNGTICEGMYNEIAVSRPFLNLGGHFSILRIGIRCMPNGSAVGTTPSFYIGAQSGSTKQPFDASWVNCLCNLQIGGSWSSLGSGATQRLSPLSWAATSLVGSTFASQVYGSLTSLSCKTHSGAPCMTMTELVVGSPNWTVRYFSPLQGGTNTALAQSDFYAQMAATTPTFTGYAYQTAVAGLAFSQAAGTIDTACYGSLLTAAPLEVTDLAVTYSP